MRISKLMYLAILMVSISILLGQESDESYNSKIHDVNRKHSIGSSIFLIGNLAPGDPPHFFQFNYGYYLSPRDVIISEAITWTYYEPLGTYESSDELYPGKIRSIGIGIGYQRFHWKNLYTTIQATPFLQTFFDEIEKDAPNYFLFEPGFHFGYKF